MLNGGTYSKKKRKQDRKDREQWGLAGMGGMGLGMDYTFMLVKWGRSQ